jgi:hypothetical protein
MSPFIQPLLVSQTVPHHLQRPLAQPTPVIQNTQPVPVQTRVVTQVQSGSGRAFQVGGPQIFGETMRVIANNMIKSITPAESRTIQPHQPQMNQKLVQKLPTEIIESKVNQAEVTEMPVQTGIETPPTPEIAKVNLGKSNLTTSQHITQIPLGSQSIYKLSQKEHSEYLELFKKAEEKGTLSTSTIFYPSPVPEQIHSPPIPHENPWENSHRKLNNFYNTYNKLES